jgi:hypothetical protein
MPSKCVAACIHCAKQRKHAAFHKTTIISEEGTAALPFTPIAAEDINEGVMLQI